MPSLCDVSFLFVLANDWHAQHLEARQWIETIEDAGELIVCRVAQMGFLRLLTNNKAMMGNPLSVQAAWQIYDTLMLDERFTYWEVEPTQLEKMWRNSTMAWNSTNAWTDAYLAAFAIASNLELVSFDKGFCKFAQLKANILS